MTSRSLDASAQASYRKGLRLSHTGFSLAVVGALVAASAGPSYRFGLLDPRPAMAVMVAGAAIGVIGSLIGVVGANMVRRAGAFRDYAVGWLGVLIGAGTFMIVYSLWQQARSVPPIHDITTDPANPPAFVTLMPERQKAPNGAAYHAEENVPLQLQAYPDVGPVKVEGDPRRVFAAALEVAKGMGWDIAAADPDAGRIEAVATSRWWGFKDDVVVRVSKTSAGNVRVDLRSASRVGKGDLGANAERVRKFAAALRAKLAAGAGKPG